MNMNIPHSPLRTIFLCSAAASAALLSPLLHSEDTTPAPAEAPGEPAKAAESAPAGDPGSALESWLIQPDAAPLPSRAEMEAYLGSLEQRRTDLTKTMEYLVSKKRLRQEAAEKENAGLTPPADLTLDQWDALAKQKESGALSAGEYAKAAISFAEKLRTLNSAEKTESLKLTKLMLQREDEEPAPVRRRPRVIPVATPIPMTPSGVVHSGKPVPPPAPAGKPASGKPPASPAPKTAKPSN